MQLTSAFLRQAGKEKLNILTGPTHEAYETNLAKTNYDFFALQAEGFKPWKNEFRPVPDNYTLLQKDSIPKWLTPDVILSQNKFGQYQVLGSFAKRFGIPLVSLEHTLPVPNWPQQQLQYCNSLRGDINVFISEYSVGKWGFDINDPSVRIIHHGIDTELFSPAVDGKKKDVILSVVNDWKNRDWCCGYSIWERTIQNLPFTVVGDNPGLSSPSKSTAELVSSYNTSRIFYNTSTISPVPTALLEAMSCGCAVVSTATCMIPEIIENGVDGFISNDEKELRGYLELLMNDEQLCENMGKNARKTIETKFSLEKFVQSWQSVINEASQSIVCP